MIMSQLVCFLHLFRGWLSFSGEDHAVVYQFTWPQGPFHTCDLSSRNISSCHPPNYGPWLTVSKCFWPLTQFFFIVHLFPDPVRLNAGMDGLYSSLVCFLLLIQVTMSTVLFCGDLPFTPLGSSLYWELKLSYFLPFPAISMYSDHILVTRA